MNPPRIIVGVLLLLAGGVRLAGSVEAGLLTDAVRPGIFAPEMPSPSSTAADAPLEVGDVVFIRVNNPLYRRVAEATASWTSHVGVIVDATPGRELVAESTVPRSKISPLDKFLRRSEAGIYAIKRAKRGLSEGEKERVKAEACRRLGVFYHLGFNFDSRRQFCSKFVYEVLRSGAGLEVGEIETFRTLLAKNSGTPQWFWRLWYFGWIPWERRTITPANLYLSPALDTVREHLRPQDATPR